MKKIITVLITICLIRASAQLPTTGLVHGWTFNGGSPNDVVGVNHGTVYGTATPTVDRCGNANSAMYFNGTTDYILTSLAAATGTVNRSFSFWFRSTSGVNPLAPRSVISYGGSNPNNGSMYEITFNYGCFGPGFDQGGRAYTAGNGLTGCLMGNTWHHVAVVFDNANGLQYTDMDIYIDGVLQGINCLLGSNTFSNINTSAGNPITIGKNHGSSSRYFFGTLDDIYYWNRALTAAEVLQLYNLNACPPSINGSATVNSCSQYQYALLAPVPGAASYVWTLPSGWTGSSSTNVINVVPNTSGGVISVAVKNICNLTIATYNLNVTLLPPAALAISGPGNICPTGNYGYAVPVSAGTNWNWTLPAGWNANTPLNGPGINLTTAVPPSGNILVSGTNYCGNPINAFLPVTVQTPINLTAPDVTYCTGNSNNVTISANSTYNGGPVTYSWDQSLGIGQNHVVNPPPPSQVYNVTATAAGQCPNTVQMTVYVTSQCCLSGTTALTLVNSLTGLTPNNSYLLLNSTSLGTSINLTDIEIQMWPGIAIDVQPGVTLDLDHVHLYACGLEMWQGIQLQDGAKITTASGSRATSLIEDAVVAIEAMNTSFPSVSGGNTPIEINNVVFNKNFIGIRVGGDAGNTISNFPIGLEECVFTCRDLWYVTPAPITPASWPTTSTTDLRNALNPTTGLLAPYLGNHPNAVLLKPYNQQRSHVGIQAFDIDNGNVMAPTTGLDIGVTYPNQGALFNVIDNHHYGMDINNSGLTMMNCVFQNMHPVLNTGNGGLAIQQRITNTMNARLDLTPTTNLPVDGNRFWENLVAIQATNVYEVNIEYNTFRSERNVNTAFGPGSFGIMLPTNRFEYNISNNEFNNIHFCLWMDIRNGPYDVIGNSGNGTYAGNLFVKQNYMGPETTSGAPNVNTFVNQGMLIRGSNGLNWNMAGQAQIFSNKLNRVFKGIWIDRTEDYPVEIGGNLISLVNDYVNPGTQQYGIYAYRSTDNMVINENDLSANNTSNTLMKLVRCEDNTSNSGNYSPVVTKNLVTRAYMGFSFEGNQPNTYWWCNRLTVPMSYGLNLSNSAGTGAGIIGQQGGPSQESGNRYLGLWTGANRHTRTENSSHLLSRIYLLYTGVPGHVGVGGSPYVNGVSFINGGGTNDCVGSSSYPSVPSQRMATGTDGITVEASAFRIYPNPAQHRLTVETESGSTILVTITDLSGKVVYEGTKLSDTHTFELQFDLAPAMYLMKVDDGSGKAIVSKLVISE